MMNVPNDSCMADTNIIFRRVLKDDPLHPLVTDAVNVLLRQQAEVFLCAQNLIEFHALATRPEAANGLGMSVERALDESKRIRDLFPLLPDTEEVFLRWRELVEKHQIVGRQVYDTRIVAVMTVHKVSRILTLDPDHFRRFTEIQVITPYELVKVQ